MSTTLNLNLFAEQALAMHAKMGCEVMQELGLVDAPTETHYYRLLLAKMYQMEPALPEKEVEGPNGIVKEVEAEEPAVAAQDTLRSELKVIAKTPAINLASDVIKKNPLKFKKKQVGTDGTEEEVEVSVDFPYLAGVDYSGTCQSLKISGGLLAPCLTRRPKGKNFCKACTKLGNPHGTIQDRENVSILCYKSSKGKSELSFGTYVTKRGLEIDEVKAKILDLYGTELPNEYWSVDKVKASRVVKSVSTSSDDEASVENGSDAKVVAKKRGRPKTKKPAEAVAEEKPAEAVTEEKPAKAVTEEKPSEAVTEEKPAEAVTEEKPAEAVTEEKPAEVVTEEKPAKAVVEEKPKKTKKDTKKTKKEPENTEEDAPITQVSIKYEDLKEVQVEEEEELREEPVSDDEASQVAELSPVSDEKDPVQETVSVEKKNGSVKKLNADHLLVFWEDSTYVIDLDDNCVWSHDDEYEIVACLGEWDPETKTVSFDED